MVIAAEKLIEERKKRVFDAVQLKEPDRVPCWCGSSPEFWDKAKGALGLDDEELRLRFRDDFRRVYSVFVDPFFDDPTLSMFCDILDPDGDKTYSRDPRGGAQRAERLVRSLGLASDSFPDTLERLLAEAAPGRPETVEQVTRFLLAEIARRPHERGLLFAAPGLSLEGALRDGLDALRGLQPRTEIVVLGERQDVSYPGLPLTWVSPSRAGGPPPFLVHFGEGAPFAMVRDADVESDATTIYQTSDRALVEQLAFQLGRDLGIPMGE